ncbi:efflux transporter outer membrane subunit [Polystyrenella longa]|uniref:efflux transporter outer membrane subunit n=1 Tax=Polystyrenella longa TaxID=2528007 RepID=UPI001E35875E|nr:efflux transporter outer membrane subunit [Polystyrenella longa]
MTWVLSLTLLSGCSTTLQEFVHNGFKVGPEYQRPPAPLADAWIDSGKVGVSNASPNYSDWWAAFDDPVLNNLIVTAYEQNVNLRVASIRVLEARAQKAIAVGTLFPQSQSIDGSYTRTQTSKNVAIPSPIRSFSTWNATFGATWEIDFWGKIRRIIESTDDVVDASVDDYDNVMVSLIGDVASTYVTYRVLQQQLQYLEQNISLQEATLKIATERWEAGQTNELGTVQATSLLEQLKATIPTVESGVRVTQNQLCVLLGMPPTDLAEMLGKAPIPESPPEVLVGIPADLIRRRPDLRSAERFIAAQNAQIGVAEADFYPNFFISGNIGYQAKDLDLLFGPRSGIGQITPGLNWDILNYGRIANNVRLQEFKTQELVAVYQQKVLVAAREVENGIINYLNSQVSARHLTASVAAAERAVTLASAQYNAGVIDFTSVFVAEQFLVQQQNLLAQAQGDIALGLITVYRSLGGGWELRLSDPEVDTDSEVIPTPSFETFPDAPTFIEPMVEAETEVREIDFQLFQPESAPPANEKPEFVISE